MNPEQVGNTCKMFRTDNVVPVTGHMKSVWAVDNFFADGAMTNPDMLYETFDGEPDSTFWIFWPGGKIDKFCYFNTRQVK